MKNPFRYCFLTLLLPCCLAFPAERTVVSIPSKSMKKSFKAEIITPSEYVNVNGNFSTIYLLHGYSGDYTTWSRIVPLESYADAYHVIIVCPDGNFNSWYVNSPVRRDSRFETYVADEVVSFVDSAYRTWAEADGRAIIGTSMGGHGATTILARHPDKFCGAGSISGIMDLTDFPANGISQTSLEAARTTGTNGTRIPSSRCVKI